MSPRFSGPTGRQTRTLTFTLLGLSSFVPVVHGIILHGFAAHDKRMGIKHYLGLGACHATGSLIYAARVPERWYPGRFDVVSEWIGLQTRDGEHWLIGDGDGQVGSSHQVMHVCVVLGAVAYGVGVLWARTYWLEDWGMVC
jgi:adiponectin receptor